MLWRILIQPPNAGRGYVETGTGFVYDDNGVRLSGLLSYSTTDTNPAQPGWYVATPPPPADVVAVFRRIRRWAFRARFTDAERVAIERAGIDASTDTAPLRNRAALVRAFLRDMDGSEFIDLDAKFIQAALNAMEAGGIIGAGRAAQIYSPPPAGEEIAGAGP